MPRRREVPIAAQIACVQRELRLRNQVYPSLVDAKRLSQDMADAELETMYAVLRTLRAVQLSQATQQELFPMAKE